MGIQGTGLTDKNIRLRFFALFFIFLVGFGVAMYWRKQTFKQAEYVDFPVHTTEAENNSELRSKNYQLEVQDSSPTVK